MQWGDDRSALRRLATGAGLLAGGVIAALLIHGLSLIA